MSNNIHLDKLMELSRIRNLGIKKEAVHTILQLYEDIVFRTLLENGHIELENGIIVDVVQLLDRVHVLRGVSYKSSRKYKLKLTMEDKIYKRIEEYYDTLKESIK